MTQQFFTKENIWLGGHFQLAIELAKPSHEDLLRALQLLWNSDKVEGCYLSKRLEPDQQDKFQPEMKHVQNSGHLNGIATLPNGKKVACLTYTVSEYEGSDWLGFSITMGALSTAYPVKGYSFVNDKSIHKGWILELEAWFYDLAQHIFEQVPFALGLIGHEVSGWKYASDFEAKPIPDERWIAYLLPSEGSLKYYPTNKF